MMIDYTGKPRTSCRGGLKAPTKLSLMFALFALLAGCASIPLGTLWKMRNFDAADLAKVQPQQVRLAGRVDPAPQVVDPTRSKLVLKLTPKAKGEPEREYVFGLHISRDYDPKLIPESDPHHRWRVFELDDAGLAAWSRLQPELADARQHYRAFSFLCRFKTDGALPAGTEALTISARLELDPEQGPMTLLDRKRFVLDGS